MKQTCSTLMSFWRWLAIVTQQLSSMATRDEHRQFHWEQILDLLVHFTPKQRSDSPRFEWGRVVSSKAGGARAEQVRMSTNQPPRLPANSTIRCDGGVWSNTVLLMPDKDRCDGLLDIKCCHELGNGKWIRWEGIGLGVVEGGEGGSWERNWFVSSC